jgi:translation initiation factor IF-1
MAGDPSIQVEGTVIEELEATKFRVGLANGKTVIAVSSGQLRLDFTRVLPGSKVLLDLDPYDLSQGRIISTQR